MNLAKDLDAADHYIELSRSNPVPQFEQIKKDNPHGFDIVVEATGSVKILEDAINYCRRGGTLVVYGCVLASIMSVGRLANMPSVSLYSVYAKAARVSWPPSKIFGDELRIIGSFSEVFMFRRSPFPMTGPAPAPLLPHLSPSPPKPATTAVTNSSNSPNNRLPRLRQDQDQGHRQQGVQARGVRRGAREHPQQDGH